MTSISAFLVSYYIFFNCYIILTFPTYICITFFNLSSHYMKWSFFFSSAVGRKYVMALTGLFLISFLLIHVGLNACIFADWVDTTDNGKMFNKAAHFMGSTIVTRILEIVLFAGFIIHIIQGYVIEAKNRKLRGQGYKQTLGNRGSPWMSRSMALLGTLIFLF